MRLASRRLMQQIGPFSTEVGFPTPPEITFHDVHNYDSATELA